MLLGFNNKSYLNSWARHNIRILTCTNNSSQYCSDTIIYTSFFISEVSKLLQTSVTLKWCSVWIKLNCSLWEAPQLSQWCAWNQLAVLRRQMHQHCYRNAVHQCSGLQRTLSEIPFELTWGCRSFLLVIHYIQSFLQLGQELWAQFGNIWQHCSLFTAWGNSSPWCHY